ncbi:MAG: zf-HC2 domain-containing protein [Deltaproteobacteria bacterium]|nr:zf-HC2 domain-containing protein [Deltaproteobacteria bacterium]
MNPHVERLELAAYLDGECSKNRTESIATHLSECRPCRESLSTIERSRSALCTLSAPEDPAFVAELEQRAARKQDELRQESYAHRVALLSAAVAASAMFSLYLYLEPSEELVARGGPAGVERSVGAWVTVVSPAPQAPTFSVGDSSRPSIGREDSLELEVSNRTEGPLFVMLFAIDGAREVHWFYPAYLSNAENPSSVSIPTGRNAMPERVRMKDAPAGSAELVAVFSQRALTVREVEAKLSSSSLSGLRSLADPVVIQSSELELR